MLGLEHFLSCLPRYPRVPFGSMWLAYGHDSSVFESSTTEMLF